MGPFVWAFWGGGSGEEAESFSETGRQRCSYKRLCGRAPYHWGKLRVIRDPQDKMDLWQNKASLAARNATDLNKWECIG